MHTILMMPFTICIMFAATLHLTRANIHILSTIIASSIHATHAFIIIFVPVSIIIISYSDYHHPHIIIFKVSGPRDFHPP